MKESTVWDPLRKKEVVLTPEEKVRQWFISVLEKEAGVPLHMMMSEVEMKYGSASKVYRADILVYDRSARPLAIVECKRPDIRLSRTVMEQALRYNMVLNVRYIIITNGISTFIHDGTGFISSLPGYDQMQTKKQQK